MKKRKYIISNWRIIKKELKNIIKIIAKKIKNYWKKKLINQKIMKKN